jgi:hypothetical protein
MLWRVAHQHLLLEGVSEKSEIGSGLATPVISAAPPFDQTVDISPIGAVKRHSTGRHGTMVENIYVPAQSRL